MTHPGPVGIFDSGLGGLTVLRAVQDTLPGLDVLYFGDTARIPYGTKSAATVTRYAHEIAGVLLDAGAQVLVVACNTASALALPDLAAELPVPVIGVLEPGAAAAVQATRTRHVAVLGTRSTVASGAYARAVNALNPRVVVQQIACPLFVPLAEEQWLNGPVPEQIVAHYLHVLHPETDTVVLGCTHYPLLVPLIQAHVGSAVTLIDSARATAERLQAVLAPDGWCPPPTPGTVRALVSDDADAFMAASAAFIGRPLTSVIWHRW